MADTTSDQPLQPATARQRKPLAERTLRVLAVIDGSEASGRVINQVLQMEQRGAIEVVVLNVQPKPQDWRLRGWGWFQREAIQDRLMNDLGQRVIASAARQFDAAGIAHRSRIEVGDAAETIARCVRGEGCDVIVLAEPRPGAARLWLMKKCGLPLDSIAGLVSLTAQVPVVLTP